MKKLLLLLIIVVLVTSCASNEKKNEVTNVTTTEAKEMIDTNNDIVILDVRTEEEFANGHIMGALNVPRDILESLITIAITDLNTQIIVYCQSGARSAEASEKLIELGYQNVYNMTGGISNWPFDIN